KSQFRITHWPGCQVLIPAVLPMGEAELLDDELITFPPKAVVYGRSAPDALFVRQILEADSRDPQRLLELVRRWGAPHPSGQDYRACLSEHLLDPKHVVSLEQSRQALCRRREIRRPCALHVGEVALCVETVQALTTHWATYKGLRNASFRAAWC